MPMNNNLLNLAEAVGMRYVEGHFIFTYEQLEEFYRLVVKENEENNKNS